MKIKGSLALLIAGLGLSLFLWITGVDGRPFRLDKLPDKGQNWGCGTCHVNPAGGGPRNAFGKDYERIAIPAGDVYTDALGQEDSDGDGFSNDEEFHANPATKPWDASSHPPKQEPQAVSRRGKLLTLWGKLKRQRR